MDKVEANQLQVRVELRFRQLKAQCRCACRAPPLIPARTSYPYRVAIVPGAVLELGGVIGQSRWF